MADYTGLNSATGEKIYYQDASSITSNSSSDMDGSILHSKNNKILLDNISNHYSFEDSIVLSTSILGKYEHIIKSRGLSGYVIEKKYFYRPEYVSNIVYATTDLWYLILFMNNMKKPDEFVKEEIIIFDPTEMDLLNNIIEQEKAALKKMSEPEKISRQMMRSLNAPSKSILGSSSFEARIAPIGR
jgi:hypothetical protein